MIHTVKSTIEKILYNPIVLVLLTPISYLMIGTIYALQYTAFNSTVFLLLYALLFINYYIENYFSKYMLFAKTVITPKFLVLELLNIAIIVYISFSSNYLVAMLITLYSLIIHFQHALKAVGLPSMAIVILSFFKGGILTYLSFFVQIQFVPLELFKWSVPLIASNLFIETGTYFSQSTSKQQDQKSRSLFILLLITLTYITSLLFLYSSFQYLLWLFLLTIPFVFRFVKLFNAKDGTVSKRFSLKTICIFQLIYLFTFAIIESLYFNIF